MQNRLGYIISELAISFFALVKHELFVRYLYLTDKYLIMYQRANYILSLFKN